MESELTRCPFCVEEIHRDASKCKHCHTWLRPTARLRAFFPASGKPAAFEEVGGTESTGLTRSPRQRMVAGVCGGLARHFGMEPTTVRLIFAAATIGTGVLPGVIAYGLMAVIIPVGSDAPIWT